MDASARRLHDLAELVHGAVHGNGEATIDHVASVDEADARALTFAVDERWLDKALHSHAAAVLGPRGAQVGADEKKPMILVDNVRAALATILSSFAPPLPTGTFTHPTAMVDPSVKRGENVWIGPGVIVEEKAMLGSDVRLLAGAYVGANTQIGAHCVLYPKATVLNDCIIGEHCVLKSGCVIGSDGFGFARVGAEQIKIPQIGNVVLGDRVEVGANSTIDRAVTGSTTVGAGTKIDNLVQIAHNVQIGDDSTICAQTGIAGSTRFGKRVISGGQAGITGHVEIGDGTIMAAGSKVISSWPPNSLIGGHYASPHRENLQQQVLFRKLPKLFEQVRTLMDALDELRKTRD